MDARVNFGVWSFLLYGEWKSMVSIPGREVVDRTVSIRRVVVEKMVTK